MEPLSGHMVWVSQKGFPTWPAQILHPKYVGVGWAWAAITRTIVVIWPDHTFLASPPTSPPT